MAKFFAILLVCIGHAYPILETPIGGGYSLRGVIYSFHMPLFMLICGFFSHSALKKTPAEFLKKKAVQLLLPTVTATILLILIGWCFNLRDIISDIKGGVWFLRTLFVCYLIAYTFLQLKIPHWLAILSSSVLCLVIPGGGTLMINFLLLFFWTGFILRKYENIILEHIKLIIFFSLLAFITLLMLGEISVIEKVTTDMLFNHFFLLLKQYIVGLLGSLIVIGGSFILCQYYSQKRIITYCSKIGMHTLGIYIVQTFVLENLSYALFTIPCWAMPVSDYIIAPVLGVAFTFLCYHIVLILKQNKYINLLLLGNQS